MEKRQELFAGKAKSVYKTDDEDFVILSFRDDTSAFDGEKVEQLSRKGEVIISSTPLLWNIYRRQVFQRILSVC